MLTLGAGLVLVMALLPGRSSARESFDASETKVIQKGPSSGGGELPIPPGAKTVRLKVGELKLVLTARKGLLGQAKTAFYIPPEATRVAQVVVETKPGQVNYFLKGRGPGVSVGGEVERAWLDAKGFEARDAADLGRIQAAVKAHPVYIDVYK